MSENLHDMDDVFRDPIEAHEEMPSTRVWDAIDHQLDKKNIVRTKKKYNNLKLFSAALLLLLMSVIVFQLLTKNNNQQYNSAAGTTVNNNTETGKAISTPATAEKEIEKGNENSNERIEKRIETSAPAAVAPIAGTAPATKTQRAGKGIITDKSLAAVQPESLHEKTIVVKKPAERTLATGVPSSPATTAATSERTERTGNGSGNEKAAVPAIARDHRPSAKLTAPVTTNSGNIDPAAAAPTKYSNVRLTKQSIAEKGKFSNQHYKAAIALNKNEQKHLAGNRFKKPVFQEETMDENDRSNDDQLPAVKPAANNTRNATAGNQPGAVKIIRPLQAVWIVKNTEDAVFAPIDVSIGASDVLPAWVREKNAAAPVISKKPASFHFSVMPFFSPQFSFNRIDADEDHRRTFPQGGPNDRERIKNDETYTSSSALGILVELPLGSKWGLQSGLSYNTRSVSIQPKNIYAQLDNEGKVKYRFDCSSGYTYLSPKAGTTPAVGDSIAIASSSNNLQYIGVPLTVNYTFFGSKKFNVIPALGVMANFLVKQNIETSLDAGASQKQNITSIQGLRKTYFNGMAGLGLQYNMSKRISLNLIPALNIALSSINQHAAVKSYPNSFSVTGGIKIQF